MQKSKISIGLVACYFGKLPWYYRYFILTCKYNPTVNFLIFSDQGDTGDELPPNVELFQTSLEEVSRVASQQLSLDISLMEPYKLCDFKPAYGKIFEQYLRKFDFWGHIDIDIILGDIRAFITDSILLNYDVISVRHDFLSGYFLLFRNVSRINELFCESKDFKTVFTNDKHYCFDETNHRHAAFSDAHLMGYPPSAIPSEIDSMSHVVFRLHDKGYLNAYFNLHVVEGLNSNIRWERGRLTYNEEFEILLYHMILFKKVYTTCIIPSPHLGAFSITETSLCH